MHNGGQQAAHNAAPHESATAPYPHAHALSDYVRSRITNREEPYYVLLDEVQYAISDEEMRGEEPPRLYGVINGLLRMRNGLRRSQELDDLVDVLASSIGALTNPRTNCPHRRRSRRRSLAARDRRQLPEDRPRTRRGQTRPRRARHPHDERLRFPPRPGQSDDVTPWIGYNVLDSPMRDE